jgi:hypothetical protein
LFTHANGEVDACGVQRVAKVADLAHPDGRSARDGVLSLDRLRVGVGGGHNWNREVKVVIVRDA